MDEELGPGSGAGERLSVREAAVAKAIEDANGALGLTYRRILEMSKPGSRSAQDPLAALIFSHLCRELVNRLPFVLGTPAVGRDDDDARIRGIVEAWPKNEDGHFGEPGPEALALVTSFIEDRASRAAHAQLLDRMISAQDRSRAGYAAASGVGAWVRILDLADARRHFDKPPTLTEWSEVSGLAGEITNAAYAFLGPFVGTTEAIDAEVSEALRTPGPDPDRVARIVGMLATPRQVEHMLARVPTSWLPALAEAVKGRTGFFAPPPDQVAAGPGLVAWPTWPAGEFLARAAADQPELALRLVWVAKPTLNPLVLWCVVKALVAAPPETAAKVLASSPDWPEPGQPAAWRSESFVELGLRLVVTGKGKVGFRLLGNLLAPLVCSEETMADHYAGTILKGLSDGLLPPRASAYLGFLTGLIRAALDEDSSRDHGSENWLPRIGEPKRYGASGHPWRVVNEAYAAALAAKQGAFAGECKRLLADPYQVTKRLAMALLAARPQGGPGLASEVLGQPGLWFRPPLRREFRELVRAGLGSLDPRSRAVLIGYAAAAEESTELYARAKEGGWDPGDEETYRAHWQSRMLAPAAEMLTDAEKAALSPRFPVEVREEIGFEIVREPPRVSPITAEQIAERGPDALAEYLGAPEAPGSSGEDAYLVSAELGKAVGADPGAWAGRLGELAALGPRPLYHAVIALQGALEKGAAADWAATFDWLAGYVSDPAEPDRLDCARAACRLIVAGTTGEQPTLPPDAASAAVRLAAALLASPDPSPEEDARRRRQNSDPLSDSLAFVRAEAVYAASWLLFRLREGGQDGAELEAALLDTLGRERSPAVWASVGRSVPPLLAGSLSDPQSFVERTLGQPAEPETRVLVWGAYLDTCQTFGKVVQRLEAQYAAAAAEPEASAAPRQFGEPRRVMLGSHLVRIALWRSRPEADDWLRSFYRGSLPESAERVSRLLADFLDVEMPEAAGEFVLTTLAWRIEEGGAKELRSIGWSARSRFQGRRVYETVVLPALLATRTEGRPVRKDDADAVGTDDDTAALAAMVAFVAELPRDTGRALRVVLNQDLYDLLPRGHGDEIETVLRGLLASADEEARGIAVAIINDLAARRFDRFVKLLPGHEG
jgi:hypothetical protein